MDALFRSDRHAHGGRFADARDLIQHALDVFRKDVEAFRRDDHFLLAPTDVQLAIVDHGRGKLGLDAVHLPDQFRVALFDLTAVQADHPPLLRRIVRAEDGTATAADAPLVYSDYDWRQPTLVVFGNEARGVSSNLAAQSDTTLRIPLHSPVESLNVAAAAAVVPSRAAATNRRRVRVDLLCSAPCRYCTPSNASTMRQIMA